MPTRDEEQRPRRMQFSGTPEQRERTLRGAQALRSALSSASGGVSNAVNEMTPNIAAAAQRATAREQEAYRQDGALARFGAGVRGANEVMGAAWDDATGAIGKLVGGFGRGYSQQPPLATPELQRMMAADPTLSRPRSPLPPDADTPAAPRRPGTPGSAVRVFTDPSGRRVVTNMPGDDFRSAQDAFYEADIQRSRNAPRSAVAEARGGRPPATLDSIEQDLLNRMARSTDRREQLDIRKGLRAIREQRKARDAAELGRDTLEQNKAERESADALRQAQITQINAQLEPQLTPPPVFDQRLMEALVNAGRSEEANKYAVEHQRKVEVYDALRQTLVEGLLLMQQSDDVTLDDLMQEESFRRAYTSLYIPTRQGQVAGARPGAAEQFAMGGMVGELDDRWGPMEKSAFAQFAKGGPVMPGFAPEVDEEQGIVQAYGQYLQQAAQAGIPQVPFEEFASIASAPQGYANGGQVRPAPVEGLGRGAARRAAEALRNRRQQIDEAAGYADGGPVDVSGQFLMGPGTPKSDSIPAVIDGSRPAALSTREFVVPEETVYFHGLDKLNKMVAKSREAMGAA